MSNRKVRAGHRTFLEKVISEAGEFLEDGFAATSKAQLLKWKASIREQYDKIAPLDELILAEMAADEKSTEEEIAEEIERSGRLRVDAVQTLATIEERLTEPAHPPLAPLTPPPHVQESQNSPNVSLSSQSGQQKVVRAKLPKLEVKKFNGKLCEWQEFWDSFESAIHQNDGLSNVDKFSYLRSLLLEPARSAIGGFALTSANYESAIELLKKRYGKKIIIQRALVNELLNARPVFNESDTLRLRHLYDFAETKYRALQALGVEEKNYSEVVVPALLKKVPDSIRLTITRGREYLEWTLGDMLQALLIEVELREEHCPMQRRVGPPSDERTERKDPFTSSALFTAKGQDQRCAFCLGTHRPEECKKITSVEERKKLLIKFGRCFKCINKGHRVRDCKISVKCKNCNGSHNTCLCEAKPQKPLEGGNTQNVVSTPSSFLVGTESRIALQTAQALIKGSVQGRVRVLFDSGSHKSFVTAKAASNYGLGIVRKEWVTINTFGQSVKESGLREVVQFDVMPLQADRSLRLEAYVVPEISNISNEHVEVIKNDYPHLRNLWFSDVCQTKEELVIDLLIGSDYLWEFQKGRTVRGESEEPVAVETELGWVLSGPLKRKGLDSLQEVSVNFAACDSVVKDSLESAVSQLWDLESLGIKASDDVHESFESEIGFIDGRYTVKLPWKEGHEPLPSNYANSLSRMKGQIKRLKREPEVLEEYDSIIKDQLSSGVIESVTELEGARKVHYLPHQAVIRKDAETTKLRIVYDASAKESKNGTSLNDCLHTGPSLTPLLFEILVRFRENRIALVGDIEKAFLNISVDVNDRDCLRFLWVDDVRDSNPSVVVYRFCRVVFGLNASPFLLNGTIRHHLATFAEVDPEFVRKMIESFYVDDLVSGDSATDKAYDLYSKAKTRMAEGGFKLRKWKTNDPELMKRISSSEAIVTKPEIVRRLEDEETYAKSKLECQGGSKGERVLGVKWNCELDTFHLDLAHIAKRAEGLEPTKRNMLSLLASLFDPLGLISPVTVSMKILFQEICSEKLDWDEMLTGEIVVKWSKWVKDLLQTGEIKVDRCLYEAREGPSVTECYLHGFGDASKKAYCAMVYFVYRTDDGQAHVRLVASKTKVAPLKELTIPRLELMSARILAQLMSTVRNTLQSQVTIDGVRFWLDSKTALSWIRNKGEWKQFVRHRVNEILRLTDKEEWAYCSTLENPADLGSRGVLASQLKEDELWWHGPQWLTGRKEEWPVKMENFQTPESLLEVKKTTTALVVETKGEEGIAAVVPLNDYSKLQKLVCVVAWVRRFVNNMKASLNKREDAKRAGKLEVRELNEAEIELVKSAQDKLKKQGNFEQLVSELGIVKHGEILRCEGRLVNSDLEFDARRPFILPRKHHLTELIVRDCHERVHHSGVRATLAQLRSKYWVPKGRQEVKRVLSECVTCKKLKGKPYSSPPIAALPEFRVREAPPFSRVGVDFAGPLYVKSKMGEMEKVYIALFSCCVTRAIHLELVEDLSAAAFRRCLRRFTARRGTPALIVSDNAKTFQATEKALNKLFDHPEIQADLEHMRVEWKFNLERAPWWGGFFERMVASVKDCLRKTLGNARLSYEELLTVLVEVECTLNARPLTYEYNEIDGEVLTPSHLIYGRRIKSLPDEVIEPEDVVGEAECSTRFKYLSTRLSHFWNRWRREYLASLREFHRCNVRSQIRTIEVGDVVVVHEDEKKRGEWKIGVVESLVKGKDSVIRGAMVRVVTKGKPTHLSRPVQKLYPLEIKSKGEGLPPTDSSVQKSREVENPTRIIPRRNAALDSRWKSRLMLDS